MRHYDKDAQLLEEAYLTIIKEATHKCDKCGGNMCKHHNEEKAKKGYKYCSKCDRTYSPEGTKGASASYNKDNGIMEYKYTKESTDADPQIELTKPLTPTTPESTAIDYSKMSIRELARIIRKDWRNVYFGAVPYLQAMFSLERINDNYGMDDGRSIVAYFLSNASQWKGPVAKEVKKELNKRLKDR